MLLFRFVHKTGPMAGQDFWATPGGGVEDDESFAEAAIRELREETGIVVREIGAAIASRDFELLLPDGERVVLAATRLLREAYLQQDAFDAVDRFSSPAKTAGLLRVILHWIRRLRDAVVEHHISIERVLALPVRKEILQMRFDVKGDGVEEFGALSRAIDAAFAELLREQGAEASAPGALP